MKKFYEDEHGDTWIRFRCKGICCKTTQRKTKKMIRVDCVNNHKNIGTLEKPTLVNKIDGSPLAQWIIPWDWSKKQLPLPRLDS